MSQLHQKSVAELRGMLDRKDVSSVELARHFLARIKAHDGALNSFISVTEAQALEAALAADHRIAAGQASALTGIPLAHKDIFCTLGVKTSCGSRMLDNFIAPYNATVVERLRQAGTVMLGKLNMDEFAMGSTSESSHYGATRNPWDVNAVPGGSSGGSAAALAAGLAPIATGTDTGGSIRQPAAYCGVTGLKPTYGRVSRYGMVAYASSLDQGGPMARSAEDCALLLNGMAGFDPLDSTSSEQPTEDYSAQLGHDLSGLTIGLPREYFGDGLDAGVAQAIDEAVAEFRKLGAEVREVSLPNSELAIPAYYVIAPAEASSNLSRFDGVRFGHRCEAPRDLADLYERSRAEGFGSEVKRRIMIGAYALSSGYYDAYYLKAQRIRRLIADDFRRVLGDVDVIMGPVAPHVAPDLGTSLKDPVAMYLSDIYTVPVNLAGLPAMSIPVGFSHGRPVGLQIIGRAFAEARLLNIAHRFQQATDWHRQSPAAFA
ncbi:MAG: Asp-tRNA(Asn)/Glu-tRNA(Gln) amidotransferase subunit GatA [Halothiobacillaceae bacterium]|nr:MAG: Asp-tRNA(Asn)/Glu-tRNA(Gln) amidotransferase subunit GatA [Halothiobacillaceae bacterium]